MSARTTFFAAAVSAAGLWAAMPPVGFGPLAWVALVPVALVALASGGRGSRLAVPLAVALYLEITLIFALPFGIADGQWGEPPLPVLLGGSPVLVVAAVAVPLFGALLYAIRFPQPLGAAAVQRLPSRWAPFALLLIPALCWAALDFLRIRYDPGGFWGPLFISQHDDLGAPLATLAGPWLVTLAIVAVNWSIALVLLRRAGSVPAAAATVGFVVVLLLAAPAAPTGAGGSGTVTVAAVQPGYDTSEDDLNDRAREVLRYFDSDTYDLAALDAIADIGALTREAAARGARLVVWPEASLWVDPRRDPPVRAALGRLARATRADIVVPYFLPGPGHSATVTVLEDGGFSEPQPKQRRMWFWGEHAGNRTAPHPVPTSAGSIGTTLGVDNQSPRPARLLVEQGADVVTSSTHDWAQLAAIQKALAQLHAVETQTPLVRADWRYGSAIFDGSGRSVADAGNGRRRTVLTAAVPRHAGSSPYVTVGDLLGWIAVAVAGGLALSRFRASRAPAWSPRHRRPAPSSRA